MKMLFGKVFCVLWSLAFLFSPGNGSAATLITTNSQASGLNWNGLIWKTNVTDSVLLAPVAGNSYMTIENGIAFGNNANNTRLRNPAAAGLQTFPGDSLTLNTNTEIRLKTAGAILSFPGVGGNPGLVLNGGCLNTGDATTNFTVAGRINVAAPSVFDFGNPTFGVIDTTRGAFLSAVLTGSGSLTLETANAASNSALVVLGTNSGFQGDWIVCGGYIKAVATNSLGSGNLIIGSTKTFGGAVAGPARAELMYDISTPGSLVISNNGQLFLHQNCVFRRVTINSSNLTAGVRTFAQLSSAFPANFVSGGSGSITVPGPLNLLAAAGSGQVNLSWTGSAGATNYVILRSSTSGGPYTRIATNSVTSFIDTTVAVNGTYYYSILAQDSLGETAQSQEALASPPPLAPTNLSALSGDNRVTLFWNTSVGATNYLVKRANVSGGPYASIGASASATFIDNSVVNNTTYFYVVSAVNGAGESSNSSEVAATPTVPPSGLVAIGGNLQISLDWSDYPGALSYNLRRSSNSGGPYATIATGLASSDYVDSSTLSGRTYYYVVAAQLASGESGYSAETSAATIPGAPINISASPLTHTAVSVSWSPADPVVTGYKLEQSLNGVDFLQIAALSAAQTSLPVTGLLAQTSYSFRVRATNASGDSPYSAIATIVTPFFGARVNFQDTNTYVLPAAFVADGGMVFGDRTNTYTYGWDVDNTANGRRRANAAITNILLDSFTHMQKLYPPRVWEIAVPNGAYRINLAAGDANTTGTAPNVDSLPRLDVEGVLMLTGIPTTNAPFVSSSNNSVFVSDGRLTLSVDPSVTNTTFSFTDSVNVVHTGNIAANNKVSFIEFVSIDPLPPSIVTQPKSGTNVFDDTVVLSVTSAGTFPQTYQWRKNGASYPGGVRSTVSLNTSLLTFANVQSGDSGDYDVVISNAVGVVTSAVAHVTVARSLDGDPPVITSTSPAAGATVSTWGQVMVVFSEPVAGVQPWDLLLNNIPAVAVTNSGNAYFFTASQPAAGTANVRFDQNHGITDLAGNRLNEASPSNTWTYFIVDAAPPLAGIVYPAPGAVVSRLDSVQVTFNENVTGVDASDLLINGVPAGGVSGSGLGPYTFTFTQPPNGVVQFTWAAANGIMDTAATPNSFAGGSWSNSLVTSAAAGTVIINEFLANNVKGIANEFGDQEDWIELFNPGGTPVSLLGWSLTDDSKDNSRWTIPNVTLGPGQFLVIFADGRDSKLLGGTNKLHTNFKINDQGGYLALFNAEYPRAAMTEFVTDYPPQRGDYSYGLNPASAWSYYGVPTPGAPNGASTISGITPEPHVNASRGLYDQPFSLVVSCPLASATLRYTTDGSAPTEVNGQAYAGPLTISNTIIFRVAAFSSNSLPSAVNTHSYIFVNQVLVQSNTPPGYPVGPTVWTGYPSDYEMDPEIITNNPGFVRDSLLALPTLSLSMSIDDVFGPVNGIYTHPEPADTQRALWERACSAEFILTNGQTGFQVDCGIRIEGNASRTPQKTPKHPFRLMFRGAYGPGRLEYPIYPDSQVTSFDTIIMRSEFNNHWTHWDSGQRSRGSKVRDAWGKETFRAMNGLAGHTRFMHLYINGIYWGVYDFGERVDSEFAASYLGGTGDQYDAIASKPTEAIDGTITAYNAMIAIGRNTDMRQPANYNLIQQSLDMPVFMDYMILNFYAANQDWGFDGNWNAVRKRAPGEKFKYTTWDCEQYVVGNGDNRVTNGDVPSGLHTNLVNSPEYRLNFADRVHRYCFNGGILTPGPAAQRWTNLSAQVGPGMLAESARWGDYRRDVAQYQTGPYLLYTTNDFWWPEIERMRTNYFPQRTDTLLTQLRSVGLYPNLSAPVFSQHGGRIPRGFSLSMTATNPIYFTTNANDPRVAVSGAVSEEASIYSGPITLNSSVLVKARTRVGTNWSALNEAAFSVNDVGPQLHFIEIMYNPQGGDAFEFLELRNDGPAPLDVSGWLFENLDYTFPAGALLAPGQTIVLANNLNPAAFGGRYPGVSVFGYFGSKLSNDGERIAIKKPSGEIVVSVEYGDSKGWPKAADGSGYSLEVVDAFGDPNAPSNWRATSFNGTPGFASSNPPVSDVRLNEILAENTSAVLNGTNFPDYVELFNAGSTSASVAGWSLTDDGNARKFVFPAGTSIPAGGYLVVWCDTNSTAPGLHARFNLSHNGETVSLFNSLTSRVDVLTFGFQLANYSVGLIDGQWVLGTPTPNASNVAAGTAGQTNLVINEWLANPPSGGTDWLELFNNSASPVSLRGVILSQSNTLSRLQSLSFIAPFGHLQLFADQVSGQDHLDFKLPAAAGVITLYDNTAAEINKVIYGQQAANISQGRFPDGSTSITNFVFSPSPGASNYVVSYIGPVLNEIMAKNVSTATNSYGHTADWVELFNPLATAFDLSGFRLSTDPNQPGQWGFPSGLTIPANGYLVVWFDGSAPASFGNSAELNTGIALGASGDSVYLLNVFGLVADSIQFGAQAPDLSIGRSGAAWTLLASASPGAANGAPATFGPASALLINEWLADAYSDQDQFLELFNPSGQPVELSGLYLTDDLSIPGQAKFQVAPLSFIGPGGYAEFKADSHPSKGPNHLNFSLDANSESIRLSMGSTIIDTVVFGLQAKGLSQGRVPDGGSITSLPCPTPGLNNSAAPEIPISTQPLSAIATPGGIVVFSVRAESGAHLIYQWLHNGSPLPNQTDKDLYIMNAQAADAGNYSVTINSGCSSTNTSATLRVLTGPIPGPNQVAIIQSPGAFTVRFVGNPGATYLLKRSFDLVNWETILTQAAAGDGYIEYSEPAVASGAVFYRMLAQ